MKNLAWAATVALLGLTNCMVALPAPRWTGDPKRIVYCPRSPDSWDNLSIGHDKAIIVREHPAMHDEMLRGVDDAVEGYRKVVANMDNDSEWSLRMRDKRADYRLALKRLEQDAREVRSFLLGKTSSFRDRFEYLLKLSPKEIFSGAWRNMKQYEHFCGMPFDVWPETFELRAIAEEHYAYLLGQISAFVQQHKLSKSDRKLRERIERHLKKAREQVISESALRVGVLY